MKAKDFESFIKNIKDKNKIIGEEDYLKFAIFVSIVKLENDYHFLFQKRSKNIRQGSEICFPGGKYDELLDRSFEDTAVRETCEELGLDKEKIIVISKLNTLVSSIYIENYLGLLQIENLDQLFINKDEVESVFTIPIDYFIKNEPERYSIKVRNYSSEVDSKGNIIEYFPVKELDIPEKYHDSWDDLSRDVYVYRTEYGTIWGITARILYDTVKNYLI